MISAYLLATTLFLSQASGEFAPGSLDFSGLAAQALAQRRTAEKAKIEYEAYLERLRVSNYFSDADFYHILDHKTHDLKVIQAILGRYENSFRILRESCPNRACRKTRQIFTFPLYDYVPNKDITYIIHFLWNQLKDLDISHAHKKSEMIALITRTKINLIYLRDLTLRHGVGAAKMLDHLGAIDNDLAAYRSNKEWDKFDDLLRYLNNL